MAKTFFDSYDIREADGVDPINSGTMWHSTEEDRLINMFRQGISLWGMVTAHKRTAGAILERLRKLGLIRFNPEHNRWDFIDHTKLLLTGTGIGIGANIPDPWAINPYTTTATTNITPSKETTMTKPLEHKAFLFGSDITTLANETIVNHIKRASEEINSYASIPDNKYTKMRIANLQDAIEAAVKELNKRGD